MLNSIRPRLRLVLWVAENNTTKHESRTMNLRHAIAAFTLSLLGLNQTMAQMQFGPAIGPPPVMPNPSVQTQPSQFPPLTIPEPPLGWRNPGAPDTNTVLALNGGCGVVWQITP